MGLLLCGRCLRGLVLDDSGEGVGFEACAADECAVDLDFVEECGGILRLDAAAVENAHGVGGGLTEKLATSSRIILCASTAISGVAVLPVPMAHTGS